MKFRKLLLMSFLGVCLFSLSGYAAYEDIIREFSPSLAEQEKLREEEIAKINWLESMNDVTADDLLFSEPAEGEDPAEFSKNTLRAYFTKRYEKDVMSDKELDEIIAYEIGPGLSYDDVLKSIRETKLWGSLDTDVSKLQLQGEVMIGDWGILILMMLAAVLAWHLVIWFKIKKTVCEQKNTTESTQEDREKNEMRQTKEESKQTEEKKKRKGLAAGFVF